MKLLINLILLGLVSLNGSLHAQICQSTSTDLQEVSCIEEISKDPFLSCNMVGSLYGDP